MGKRMLRREFLKATYAAAGSIGVLLLHHKLSWAEKILNPVQMQKRVYEGFKGLTDLPYFEMTSRGLLRLTVDGLDGGIDGHTHFALNGFAGRKPNLLKAGTRTEYYIEPHNKLSLNGYMNSNQTPADKQKMTKTTMLQLLPFSNAVTSTHTIPNLLAEMDLLQIEKAVVFPIKFGFPVGDSMTEWYCDAIEKSGKKDRFIVCGSVKPTAADAPQQIDAYKKKGLKGIKLHPNFSRFHPSDKAAWPAYEAAQKNDLPVLIHCGRTGQEPKKGIAKMVYTEDYADIKNFIEPVESFPRLRFVLCHAGALQNEEAVAIAKKNQNVWMDVQGQSVKNIKKMIRELGPEKLMFGSDFPFYPLATVLARTLVATEKDNKVRKMIFSENARRFWGFA